MVKSSPLRAEAVLVAAHARTIGLTQEQIAKAVGASQSQVSRILAGAGRRRSRLFDTVCKYVISRRADSPASAPEKSPALMEALADVWDGTNAHADALAVVIRSLGALRASPTPGRAKGQG